MVPLLADAVPRLARLLLHLLETVRVARVGREGGDLRQALPEERLVEHRAAGEVDVGQGAAVIVALLRVELEPDAPAF